MVQLFINSLFFLVENPCVIINEVFSSLGLLVPKIKEAQLQVIVDTLGDYILQNKKENLRDIAGIGLKSVVAQTAPESPTAPSIVHRVTPKLIKGIQVRLCCLQKLPLCLEINLDSFFSKKSLK